MIWINETCSNFDLQYYVLLYRRIKELNFSLRNIRGEGHNKENKNHGYGSEIGTIRSWSEGGRDLGAEKISVAEILKTSAAQSRFRNCNANVRRAKKTGKKIWLTAASFANSNSWEGESLLTRDSIWGRPWDRIAFDWAVFVNGSVVSPFLRSCEIAIIIERW